MRGLQAPATPALVRALRPVLLLCVAALLIGSIVGGLLRAGVAVPVPADGAWPGRAVLAHAFLLMSGFLGTVIGIERAVALKRRFAFAAPVASAAAGALMLMGLPAAAAWLAVLAALLFIAVSTVVVSRQNAPHTIVLLVGAAAWLVGNLLHGLGARPAAVIPWWFSFLVLTISAERLEMTRLMRRHAAAAPLLYAGLAALLLGPAAFALSPAWGGWLYGAALIALAGWLACFDIARRTVAAAGLSRYMAVCLLLGYAWLAISGLGWIVTSLGYAGRDVALHALGLGFVFGMVFAHAPVILPAVTGIKVRFGWFFYVPLIVLHASLALRLFCATADLRMLSLGATGNAAAIALFIATLVGSAVAWRMQAAREPGKKRHAAAAHD